MSDFDTEVRSIGRQKAIAFFVPRIIVLTVVLAVLVFVFLK